MLTKTKDIKNEIILSTLEDLVPQDHLVRKLDKINYDFIYDRVEEYYASDGRPSIDPVILFKIILIKNVFNLKSLRQTIKELEVNIAFRWFLNIPLSENIPHYSVVTNNFNYRFSKESLNSIFNKIKDEFKKLNLNITFTKNKKVKLKKKAAELNEKMLYEHPLV